MKDTNKNPLILFEQALALHTSGKLDQAAVKYKKALTLKPDMAEAYSNLGALFNDQKKFDQAVKMYRQAISVRPGYAEARYNLANLLKDQGKVDEATAQYAEAISLKPDFAVARFNYANLLKGQRKLPEAATQYAQAITLKPDFAPAYYNFGNLLKEQGKLEDATSHYAAAIGLKPDMAEAYCNLGHVLDKRGMYNEAIMLFEQLVIFQPDNAERLAELVHYINEACAWDKGLYETRLLEMLRQEREGIFPSIVLQTRATAEEQLLCAKTDMRKREALPQFTHVAKKSGEKIKIGYLSYDYREHATAYLMADLFERHDRARFDIIGYSYSPNDNSPMRKRLIKAFDAFVELGHLSDQEAAQKVYDDGVDILVDLKGFTGESRIDILAYRPAPVQVNYLGYPGTMGASFIDYIIADRFIIPEDQEKFYSEKVVCLPDCYQPNDMHRKIAERTPTRKDCGLPEQGFIFCCFNISFKITPQIFDIWIRLLQKVPDSVLWLFESNSSVKANLKQEAARRGVDPERIVFAQRARLPEHLARHQLADLFLDTLPVNAHTTTSDALWAGLPVLTCVGSTFAGRVAGSLLKAANLPELITYSLDEYEALALQLAQNPSQQTVIRQKLQKTRLQVPLFDIEKFTKDIEKSYQTMWDISQAGSSPKAFTVS